MMHVGGGGGGGSFTPSQWMELEHQALIYKYLTSNVPVPPNLLIPIRKALESAAFSSPAGLLRPNTLGWVGPFHLGLTSNGDLEPGRCRRTDGKKWRCSRDAVPDQKYCERHINRGRHRSRKPVEVRSAHHSIASATTNHITATNAAAAAAAAKGIPAAAITTGASAAAAAAAAAALATSRGYGGGSSCNIPAQLHHHQHHHRNDNDLLDSIPLSRMFVEEVTGGLKSNERSSSFMNSKQQHNPYAESSLQTEFGLVSSESLLNPSQKPPSSSSSLISCRSFSSSEDQQQHSLRQFMDNWPKAHQPDHFGSSHSWQETADRTELSISIPVARNPADFMSSSSSPDNEKLNVSPQELDQVHRQANWNSMSWENSMGGPLGEVLQNTNNNGSNGRRVGNQEGKSSSSLSLMTEGWDSSRASSPTEVLQKTTFVWLSNSSTGSSPRAAREQH